MTHIRTFSPSPRAIFEAAHKLAPEARADWKRVNIEKMDMVLSLKFAQHPELQKELLETVNAELVEDSEEDTFWGNGGRDGKGRNELGKGLMRLREKLMGELEERLKKEWSGKGKGKAPVREGSVKRGGGGRKWDDGWEKV